jgi:hypothetical protein
VYDNKIEHNSKGENMYNDEVSLKRKVEFLESCGVIFEEPYLYELLQSAKRHLNTTMIPPESFHNAEKIITRMYWKYSG